MKLVLSTDRLILRPYEMSDVDLEIEMCGDPDVVKYIMEVATPDEVREKMPELIRRCWDGAIGIWCVQDRSTNEKLGNAILLPMPIELSDTDWDLLLDDRIPDTDIEIGYIFKKSAWGKGFATEATKRLLTTSIKVANALTTGETPERIIEKI